jgi:diphosphoinositol-polyphosphate diphosphatase
MQIKLEESKLIHFTSCIGYGSKGERLVAGIVPLSADKTKVLMIQSAGPGGWVLPKGGWETDEPTAQQAAQREAWEEAGVVCTVQRDLGTIPDMRPAALVTVQAPKASYQFFEAIVNREEAQWPEMHKRKRQWVTYAQAASALASRPELLEALNRSSLRR